MLKIQNSIKKKLKIVLVIIGIILLFSAIDGFYNIYKQDKNYELKGWQTAIATCTQENFYTGTR